MINPDDSNLESSLSKMQQEEFFKKPSIRTFVRDVQTYKNNVQTYKNNVQTYKNNVETLVKSIKIKDKNTVQRIKTLEEMVNTIQKHTEYLEGIIQLKDYVTSIDRCEKAREYLKVMRTASESTHSMVRRANNVFENELKNGTSLFKACQALNKHVSTVHTNYSGALHLVAETGRDVEIPRREKQ